MPVDRKTLTASTRKKLKVAETIYAHLAARGWERAWQVDDPQLGFLFRGWMRNGRFVITQEGYAYMSFIEVLAPIDNEARRGQSLEATLRALD